MYERMAELIENVSQIPIGFNRKKPRPDPATAADRLNQIQSSSMLVTSLSLNRISWSQDITVTNSYFLDVHK